MRCSLPLPQRCNFFRKLDTNTSSALDSNSSSRPTSSGGQTKCKCGRDATKRVVKKPGPNKGREFYVCPLPQGDQCRFFEWVQQGGGGGGRNERAVGGQMGMTKGMGASSNQGLQSGANHGNGAANGRTSWEQQMGRNNNPAKNDTAVPVVKCKCGSNAVKRTVRKEGMNKGKEYFTCPTGGCRFFEWAANLQNRRAPRQLMANHAEAAASNSNNMKRPMETTIDRPGSAGQKRPRTGSGNFIEITLNNIDTVSFKMGISCSSELRDYVKAYEGAIVKKTDFLGVEKVILPIEKTTKFVHNLEVSVDVRVDYKLQPCSIQRIIAYREAEKRRESNGDVVRDALDTILPSIMCEKLMEFQWAGINFALQKGGRCLIGDDMGLGKTLQAIAVARIYISDWPLLIVCPSSLRLNWKEELLRWLEDDLGEDEIHVIMTGKDTERRMARVNIVSYDLLRKVPTHALRLCNFIIADESHYLKSMQAKRSQALTPLLKQAKRALLLSGTPALSRPVELFPQINAIAPILFPRYQEFVTRYCAARMGRFGYDVSGASNLEELHTLLRGTLLVRRKKEEVLHQLPDKQRQIIWVQTKSAVMKKVSKTMQEFEAAKAAAEDAQNEVESIRLQNQVRKVQNELYTLTGQAKLDSVKEFCKDTAESGCKFIVFLHHTEIMDDLDDYIKSKLKLGRIRIDGKTSQASRQGLCRQFQEDKKTRVALLSITAAGVGLTLTKATVVLFAEMYWNPGSLLQAEDRAHRIGQRDCVLVKYLLAKKTLDVSMWNTVRRKLSVVGQSLTGAAGKMDLTEKDTKEKGKGPLSQFLKPKVRKTQTQSSIGNGETQSTVEVVNIDEEIASGTLPSIPASSQKESKDNIMDVHNLPTTLEEITTPQENIKSENHSRSQSQKSRWDQLRLRQAQIDADIAMAQKLQAQFDEEARAGLG